MAVEYFGLLRLERPSIKPLGLGGSSSVDRARRSQRRGRRFDPDLLHQPSPRATRTKAAVHRLGDGRHFIPIRLKLPPSPRLRRTRRLAGQPQARFALRATARQASEGCRAGACRAEAGKSKMSNYCYVYILESLAPAGGYYVGLTEDLSARLAKHNAGEVPHTAKLRPWQIKTAVSFRNRIKAAAFEKYLIPTSLDN